MGKRYLIDTNILIDAQMNVLPEKGLLFLADVINKDFTISFITYIEFLGYKNITQLSKDFIALANVININNAMINSCITLRKAKNIKLPDAIIAATALTDKLILISRNVSDFQNITGLEVLNPYQLA